MPPLSDVLDAEATAGMLRVATAGSVDDGKSTLIGRLLHDSKGLFDDQLAAVAEASRRRGRDGVDLALLTDGLKAEREQGITIDVAYRYFATPRRSFVLADTPGHAQYTRNMATGASTADVALILVDVRNGLTEQTRRHAVVASLLGIDHVVLCVNKMDLAEFSESAFDFVVADFLASTEKLAFGAVVPVPVSALLGDNVVEESANMPWYSGPTLLAHLETVDVGGPGTDVGARLPVQYVIRTDDARHLAGMVESGTLAVGDEVVVLPSGSRSRVAALTDPDGPVERAAAGTAATVVLADEIDAGRGDLLVRADEAPPAITRELDATVVWFDDRPLRPGARYLCKHTTRTARAVVRALHDRLDVVSGASNPAEELAMNDVGRVTIAVATPLAVDPYRRQRVTGSFVLIDPSDHATVAAGMIAG